MYGYDPENRLITATKIDGPLSAACDIALPFTTGGDAEWFVETTEYNYGNSAVQSGAIGNNQSTWIEMTVTGPGTLYFDYKLSSALGDNLTLFIDDQYQFGQGGITDWDVSGPHQITGAQTHTIRWRYSKDGGGTSGSDCIWIDRVRWSGAMPDMGAFNVITYVYNAGGRRIEKKVDGSTQVKYVYDGDQCIAEYDASNNLLRKYIYGPGIDGEDRGQPLG